MTTPVFRLPAEIIDFIFSFLYPYPNLPKFSLDLEWLKIAHVCHQWREIALSQPRFWSRIDLTSLTVAGVTEMLARSKNAPLHLVANLCRYNVNFYPMRLGAVHEQLVAHSSHIRSLDILSHPLLLSQTLVRLTSPAPALESLLLCARRKEGVITRIPPTLFNHTAPRLISLELDNCYVNWGTLLLKGLRHLTLRYHIDEERPGLQPWLEALCELSRLESLVVSYATPIAPQIVTPIPEPVKAVILPSLTRLHLTDSTSCCTLALAHLILPSLTWLFVEVESSHTFGDDIRTVLPHFVRNAHGSQDTMPLQSMVIDFCLSCTGILLWTDPDADMDYHDSSSFTRTSLSARAVFTASCPVRDVPTSTAVCRTVLSALPISSLATLTVLDFGLVPEEVWIENMPQWRLLKRLRLGCSTVCNFTNVLNGDATSEGSLLPSLTKIIINGSPLDAHTAKGLRDMLSARVEQGTPIQTLDLSHCGVDEGAMRLFKDIFTDVREPVEMGSLLFSSW